MRGLSLVYIFGSFLFFAFLSLGGATDPISATHELKTSPLIVAIFDSGIDLTHPELKPYLWANTNEIANNHLDDDGNGLIDDIHGVNWFSNNGDVQDDHPKGHGTHVAGLIAGIAQKDEISNLKLMIFKADLSNPGRSLNESLRYAHQHQVKLFQLAYVQPPLPSFDQLISSRALDIPKWFRWICAFYRGDPQVWRQDFETLYKRYVFDFNKSWNQAMEKIRSIGNEVQVVASAGFSNQQGSQKLLEPAGIHSQNMIVVLNGTSIESTLPLILDPSGRGKLSGSSQASALVTHQMAKQMIIH